MAFKPYCEICNSWHTEQEGHLPGFGAAMDVEMMTFPVGNCRVEKAIEFPSDKTIGVTISMLVKPKDFDKLPGSFRQMAHDVYAAPRPIPAKMDP